MKSHTSSTEVTNKRIPVVMKQKPSNGVTGNEAKKSNGDNMSNYFRNLLLAQPVVSSPVEEVDIGGTPLSDENYSPLYNTGLESTNDVKQSDNVKKSAVPVSENHLQDSKSKEISSNEATIQYILPKSDEELANDFYEFLLSSEDKKCSLSAANSWFSSRVNSIEKKSIKLRLNFPKLGLKSNDGRFIYTNNSVINDRLVEGYITANVGGPKISKSSLKESGEDQQRKRVRDHVDTIQNEPNKRSNSRDRSSSKSNTEEEPVNLIRSRRCNLPAWMTMKKDDE